MTVQTQTAHILALHFHLAPPEQRARTARALLRLLEKENGHLVTGFMGTPFFTHALADNGYTQAAYDLLLKEDFPSWLFQVKMGATTIWEHWDGMRPDGTMWSPDMNSFNHYAYGSIVAWLFRSVLGIDADPEAPGYRHILLRPQPDRRLGCACGAVDTPYGRVETAWRYTDAGLALEVTVPVNATATLTMEGVGDVLRSDVAGFVKRDACLTAELPSGSYDFLFGENREHE
jgi:alpha-L-rhamnosidase